LKLNVGLACVVGMPVRRDHRRVTVLVLQEAEATVVAAVKVVTLTATVCPRWIAVVVVPVANC